MKGSFTARTTLSLAAWDAGPEFETEMVVKFSVCPGCAQTLTDPGEPPFAEDISIRLFTAKTKTELQCPKWLEEYFAKDDGFREWLLSEASDQAQAEREEAAERRYEMQRADRL